MSNQPQKPQARKNNHRPNCHCLLCQKIEQPNTQIKFKKSKEKRPKCDGYLGRFGLKKSIRCNKKALIVVTLTNGTQARVCHGCNWLNAKGVEWNPSPNVVNI